MSLFYLHCTHILEHIFGEGNLMNTCARTALTFGAFYVIMQVIMFAITIAADLMLGFEISSTTLAVVSLVTGLQLTSDRYARHHGAAPRGANAMLHALAITAAAAFVSGLTLLIPGVGETLGASFGMGALSVIFAFLLTIQFLVTWLAFPWFVRSALKRQEKLADKDAVKRF
jgi:hypothetical protein